MTSVADLPDRAVEILRQKTIAHVATIGPGRGPQCSPVWFLWDGVLRFSLTTSRQKFRNLKSDARLSVNVIDQGDPHSYVELRGTATWGLDANNAFIDRLAQWYLGQETYPWQEPGDERVTITLTPGHVTWLLT